MNCGAPNTNRTCDLPLRRGLLYPLSYRGVRLEFYRIDSLGPTGCVGCRAEFRVAYRDRDYRDRDYRDRDYRDRDYRDRD